MPELILQEPTIDGATVWCNYSYGHERYTHRFAFPAPLDDDDPVVRRLLRWLSAVHALYLCNFAYFTELRAEFPLDDAEKDFLEKLAFNGMAEFRQVNHIPMATKTLYSGRADTAAPAPTNSVPRHGALLLNGGGKDGCASAILLDQANVPFTWFMLNSSVAQDSVAVASGKSSLKVKRLLDQRRADGPYHGHCPTSAAIALCAVIAAYVAGLEYVVASNEQSANEGNSEVEGVMVNHQYSKSLEFELDFASLLDRYSVGVTYFSLLRPLHELQIVKIVGENPRFIGTFTSCNHGFKRGEWCLQCAKCAFVALTFTALNPAATARIWGDELVINRPALTPFLKELLDPNVPKPLECVGTLQECQLAAGLILQGPLALKLTPGLAQLFAAHSLPAAGHTAQTLLHTLSDQHNIPKAFQSVLGSARLMLGL
ncbi:MAG TPA: hypothetical protein VLE99_03340 [Candidatus Saccharimonadales bacterium]|nr:hypothetical protein [Candidatus Saccharimonadales bacterium]